MHLQRAYIGYGKQGRVIENEVNVENTCLNRMWQLDLNETAPKKQNIQLKNVLAFRIFD